MAAPAAIVAAVENALEPHGIRIHEVPLTPFRLWGIIQAGGEG
jgi:CO/xanthine dehydrogenase Mo-binding subunit